VIEVIEIDDDNTEVLSQQFLGIQFIDTLEGKDDTEFTKELEEKEAIKVAEKQSKAKRVKREPSIIIIDD
jgi:hypothetical protein